MRILADLERDNLRFAANLARVRAAMPGPQLRETDRSKSPVEGEPA